MWKPAVRLGLVLAISALLVQGSATPLQAEVQSPLVTGQKGGRVTSLDVDYGLSPLQPIDGAWSPLADLQDALQVMQDNWFHLWIGAWPTSIDWTGAVVNTHVVATLGSLSRTLLAERNASSDNPNQQALDLVNDIDTYFEQSVAYYFGEDAFAIRNQAFDDILWVVLGWLEAIKFIKVRSAIPIGNDSSHWHGAQFTHVFAHRARVFWDLSTRGWGMDLCGGGMNWNPSLEPYKNAITNELYISASVAMYLYFPGDANTSPFSSDRYRTSIAEPAFPHDHKYLQAAVDGYAWLKQSNMTNRHGLYVDGFHIRGWDFNGSTGTGKCDKRNEMVFTYNQGVLLSGLRGLWEGTGNTTYLNDGHRLVRNAIAATGWSADGPSASSPQWSGLGRNGILEESCDAAGRCSQDGQTFKSIFFHHLTLFCEALPTRDPLVPGKTWMAHQDLARRHCRSCRTYMPWVAYNARAAVSTKNHEGKFGTWWGAAMANSTVEVPLPVGAVDYRNEPVWLDGRHWLKRKPGQQDRSTDAHRHRLSWDTPEDALLIVDSIETIEEANMRRDLNDRGRGRTVETQAGGVAVLRALWELMHLKEPGC